MTNITHKRMLEFSTLILFFTAATALAVWINLVYLMGKEIVNINTKDWQPSNKIS